MSRAHCIDCGTDVTIDPLGQCPEGHLLPAAGRRVGSAIGTDDHHPEEPEPWVGQVDLAPVEPEPVVARAARPHVAPGLPPAAESDPAPGDLLRELGALGDELFTTTDPAPTSNGHATARHPGAANEAPMTPASPPPAPQPPAPSSDAIADLAELSALEQALQSLDDDASRRPAPGHEDVSPGFDDDLGRLFDDLDGLGSAATDDTATSGPNAPAPSAVPPPAATVTPSTTPVPHAPPGATTPAPVPPPPSAPADGEARWEALADVAGLAAEQERASRLPAPHASPPSPPGNLEAPDPPGSADGRTRRRTDGQAQQAPDEQAQQAPDEQAPQRAAIDTMNFTAKGGPVTGGRRRRLFGR